MRFQLLDIDYVPFHNEPVLRLFGRGEDGKSVCCFVFGFEPYFYVGCSDIERTRSELLERFGGYIRRIEDVERYEPVGYQTKKQKMLKVYTHLPSDVAKLREELTTIPSIHGIYESDILFRYRFMLDAGLGGMEWVEVVEVEEGGEGVPDELLEGIQCDRVVVASAIRRYEQHMDAPLRYLAFDIECLPIGGKMPQPNEAPIIMVSLAFEPAHEGYDSLVLVARPLENAGNGVLVFDNEEQMLREFVSIVVDYDPDVIMGYNSNGFDFPYLLDRLRHLRKKKGNEQLLLTLGRDRSKEVSYRRFGYMPSVNVVGRIVADGLSLVRRDFSLKQYTLSNVAHELLDTEKLELPFSEMESVWQDDARLPELIAYSRRDAELVMRLVLGLHLLDRYFAIARLSGTLAQDVLDRGQTVMVENLLIRAFLEHERVVYPKPRGGDVDERLEKELQGAEVLDPVKGLHENVLVLDYRSLYPTIIMAYNICYSTLLTEQQAEQLEHITTPNGAKFVSPSVFRGIVPKILEHILEERMRTRRQMEGTQTPPEQYRALDARQKALKVLLNSFYGYYGHAMARLYVPEMAAAITSYGRENILNTRRIVEEEIARVWADGDVDVDVDVSLDEASGGRKFELKVVYGDTDSVFVKVIPEDGGDVSLEVLERIGRTIANIVSERLPDPMELRLDAIAKRALFIAKKRYALWVFRRRGEEFEDSIVVRGMETVRRDWCELTSKVVNHVLELVLKEGDVRGAVQLVRKVVQQLKNIDPVHDEHLFEDLILTRRYTKHPDKYQNRQPHITVVEKLRSRGLEKYSIGDRVPFVITAGSGLMVDRAEDPEYVREHHIPLDTEYYINKQILPPVMRILELFVGKGALTGMLSSVQHEMRSDARQSTLSDFM